MKKVIYFTDGEGVKPFMFVKAYRKKSLFKRENAQLSYFVHELDIDDEMAKDIKSFIKRHYPDAVIGYDTAENFEATMYKYRYYVVTKYIKNGDFYVFDTGSITQWERNWTSDIREAQLCYEHSSAESSAQMLAKQTGEQIALTTVYVSDVNPLSEQEFVIVCESKRSHQAKFYSRTDGTRLRLVKTTEGAAKFHLNLALSVFEELKAKNKAFLYSVIPYVPNVNAGELDRMYRDGEIPVAVNMTSKLKWMDRG